MHIIGEYIYDPNRLILYKREYSAQIVKKICAYVESNDHFENLHQKLNAYDADNIQIKPGALHRIGIALTNNCNLRCNYCIDSSAEGHDEQLSVEDIIAFVSDAMKRWTINKLLGKDKESLRLYFTGGGEPTYNWEFFTMSIVQIRQKGDANNIPLFFNITTNGLLNDSQRLFISEKFDSVMVSYDGIPEVHERNRRSTHHSSTSETVEETIRFFSKTRVDLTIRTTIWQSDFCRLREMADYIFGKLSTSIEWSILPVIPTGRAMNRIRREHEKLSKYDFLTPYLDVVEYAKNRYGSVNVSTPIFQDTLNSFNCGAISIFCSCPWLLPDKTIITCIESCDTKTTIGKIEENEVVYFERFSDPLLKVYQRKFDECRTCIAYRFCKGGCPVRNLMNRNVGTTMDDWECTMIQNYWIYIFENILKGKECLGWRLVPIEIYGLQDVEVLELTEV